MRALVYEHLCFYPTRLSDISKESTLLETEQRALITFRIVHKGAMDVELHLLFISMWR